MNENKSASPENTISIIGDFHYISIHVDDKCSRINCCIEMENQRINATLLWWIISSMKMKIHVYADGEIYHVRQKRPKLGKMSLVTFL